jgi:hypothetical protein
MRRDWTFAQFTLCAFAGELERESAAYPRRPHRRSRILQFKLSAGSLIQRSWRRVTAFGVAQSDLHVTGTLKFYASAGPELVNVSAGTLDDLSEIEPTFSVFFEQRASWDCVAADIATHDRPP